MEITTVRGSKIVIQEKNTNASEWPEHKRTKTPRGALVEAMRSLNPGEFVSVVCESRKDFYALQHSVPNITVQLDLPTGSFSTRSLLDEESGKYIFYVKRNAV
jgi:hypothetical protein